MHEALCVHMKNYHLTSKASRLGYIHGKDKGLKETSTAAGRGYWRLADLMNYISSDVSVQFALQRWPKQWRIRRVGTKWGDL